MFQFNAPILGTTLFALGIAMFLSAFVFLRIIPRFRSPARGAFLDFPESSARPHNNAYFLVEPGGRVRFFDPKLKEWFHLQDNQVNLESLARDTQAGDTFLNLCALEGQAQFSIDGRLVEATSYFIPYGTQQNMLVSLRQLEASNNGRRTYHGIDPDLQTDPKALNRYAEIVARLDKNIASHPDLESTLQAVLECAESLVPADIVEMSIWEKDGLQLIPYRIYRPPGSPRQLEKSEERYQRNIGYSGYLVTHPSPLFIPDIDQFSEAQPVVDRGKSPIMSCLGVPLVIGEKVIGTLELGSFQANAFNQNDLEAIRLLSTHAAICIQNALLLRKESRSQLVFSSLKQISDSLTRQSITPEDLSLLVGSLSSLLDVEILGFLFWDEQSHTLIARRPFEGLPDEFVEMYQVTIAEGSPAERIWLDLGMIVSDEAGEDDRLQTLGLHDAAKAAGFQHTALVPLVLDQQTIGYLQAANKRDKTPFLPEDQHLLAILANLVTPFLVNHRLVMKAHEISVALEQRVEERALQLAKEHHRSEILLRIITELSASLNLEQVLNRTLAILNETADASHITCLVCRSGESKLLNLASVGYATPAPLQGRPSSLEKDRGLAGWIIANRETVLIGDLLLDPRWVKLPDAPFNHRSAIGVPLVLGGDVLGVLLLFHPEPDHFAEDQLDLVQATANQVAVTINNTRLYDLIREQAENLSALLHAQQVEVSRSRAILEAISEGVLVTDSLRKVTLFNASAQKILGLDPKLVLGRSLEHLIGLFRGVGKTWMDTIQIWSNEPTAFQPGDAYTEQITLEDSRVVAVYLSPVLHETSFLGTVSIFHDITHQVEVDRLKSEFVATVSHELRTPMTSIKGYVDILLMGAAGVLNAQQNHFLEIVKNNTDRLAVLVNDLLDISRIEAGRVSYALQPLYMHLLAENAVEVIHRRCKEQGKQLYISIECPGGLPRVIGDPVRVLQILHNLLDNAYQYTPEGGQITIRAHREGDDVQVDVQDTGIGIPLADQERVFERFFRGEHPMILATSGTGLGLSIVQQLVSIQNGHIWLQSDGTPGEGATFSFTLPVYHHRHKEGD